MSQDHAHRHPGAFSTTVHSVAQGSDSPQGQGSTASSETNDLGVGYSANATPPTSNHATLVDSPDFMPTLKPHKPSKRHVSDGFDARPNKSKRSGGFLLSSKPTSLRRRLPGNDPEKVVRKSAEQHLAQALPLTPEKPSNGAAVHPSQQQARLSRRLESGAQEYTPPRTPIYGDNEPSDAKGKERMSSSQKSNGSSAQAFVSSETSSRGGPRPLDGPDDLQYQRQRPASIDASQLVRMALSLSESRKQHLSPGQLASLPAPTPRVISLGGPPSASPWKGQSDSLPSATSTPGRRSASGAQSPGMSLPSELSQPSPANPAFPTLQHYEYQLSTSTLLRAEKAKAHFELFQDYLRLLDHLPPLQASAMAHQSSRPRLGRKYNPLQFVRNRRVRARERQTLDSVAAGWAVPMDVKQWVNAVQLRSTKEDYVAGDRVRLPVWNAPDLTAEAANALTEIRSKAEATQKQRRPLMNWSVAQEDLLADAYWMEEDRHKGLIETNQGAKVIPNLKLPTTPATYQDEEDDSELRARTKFEASSESPEVAEHKSGDQRGRGFFLPRPGTASRKGRVKRQLLGRHSTRLSDTASDVSESDEDVDRNPRLRNYRTLSSENIGPLERHMNRMMTLEKDKEKEKPSMARIDTHGSDGGRRMGMSEGADESHSRRGSIARMQTFEEAFAQNRDDAIYEAAEDSPGSFDTRAQIDKTDWAPLGDHGARPRKSGDAWQRSEATAAPDITKHRLPRFHFLRNKKNPNSQKQSDGQTTESRPRSTSRTGGNEDPSSMIYAPGSSRSSLEPGQRTRAVKTDDKEKGDDTLEQASEKADNVTAKAIFKSSRVAELAREASVSRSLTRSDSPSLSRQQSPDSARASSSERSGHRRGQASLHLPRPSIRMHGRSMSADDLREPSNESGYHVKDLPSFVSSHNKSRPGQLGFLKRIDSRLAESRHTRSPPKTPQSPKPFDGVPLLELPDSSDVSPSASVTHLPRSSRHLGSGLAPPLRREAESDSESDARSTSSRLKQTLRGSGLRSSRPVTGLAGFEANRRRSSTSPMHRSWSIADTRPVSPGRHPTVTAQDVAYVQSLLVSCGVKARAILSRADSVRDPPADFYKRAAEACGKTAEPAPVKQEHVLAARMLSEKLRQSINGFEEDATRFRSQTTRGLYEQIGDLRDHAGTRLTGRVRTGADDADVFVARLTSNHTLAVKQVNDQIDKALRSRRRRVRWLSRAGFSVLEWIVVAVMWWIWGFVLVVRIVLGFFTALWSILRWLLCL